MASKRVAGDAAVADEEHRIKRKNDGGNKEPPTKRKNEGGNKKPPTKRKNDGGKKKKKPSWYQQSPIELSVTLSVRTMNQWAGLKSLRYSTDKMILKFVEGPKGKFEGKFEVVNEVFLKFLGLKLQLKSLHVHKHAEHKVVHGVGSQARKPNNKLFEIHLVHQIIEKESRYSGMTASCVGSTLFAIGRLFKKPEKPEKPEKQERATKTPAAVRGRTLKSVFSLKTDKKSKVKADEEIKVDLNCLLPVGNESRNAFFYQGSLTSGDHDENVSWTVFADPDPTSFDDEKIIKMLRGGGAEQGVRALEKLQRRFVVRNFG